MEKDEKKITIKDVARLAGLSKGTVDRVVHNRGEVSEESKRRVLEVIQQIGYKPNIYASLLASKKHYTLLCLIPKFCPGEYWELVYTGIGRAVERARNYNIGIDVISYDQFDRESFRRAARELLDRNPQAVLLAPIYRNDTLALTAELTSRNVPYVYIDSRLEGSGYLAYFGMPMYQSGYLAASLLTEQPDIREIANFRIDRGGAQPQDNPTLRRREGFMAYLKENFPEYRVYEDFIKPYDPEYNLRVLDSFFERHPDIRHIVTFNSRVHLISEYLEKRTLKDRFVVGFDKLAGNLEGVRKGYIKFLITQRTETQVYRGITAIIEHMVFHTTPAEQDNFMSMDILTKYNVDYYSDIYEF